ncbi:bifunctional glutamate N-acetyltransferase/amino-acid acetyltransferase ArgJ [Agaribacterium haliotis]|uniref:bifunctional glutamate N-acetyltransferase/amino-acid acetyltransferase ArgJ n=1 Tax=Agaribacterium haliotis TaxID=2013869 RepID=UPI000BB52FFA|nr:bifunctional glutamate N-acetyltransferase/amino-acid acetyltransferase ArgJ [Agaribacterium haliotis]
MAVGEFKWPGVLPVDGIRLAAVQAGVRYADRLDMSLIEICDGASVSAVFTKNAFCAEPVKICRRHLQQATPRFLLINSGNANACTGQAGWQAAIDSCAAVASAAGVELNQVLPFSTGVIGEVLPAARLVDAVPTALEQLNGDAWHGAAQAMMTTDTRAKGLSKTLEIGGVELHFSAIAKGSGMIKPNMGTMLAYVATDAAIEQNLLDKLVKSAANKSFNRITVDGDTSTNDALVLMASGKAGNTLICSGTDAAERVEQVLTELCQALAIEMVRDAEGATKCVRVDVAGGLNAQESLDVAYAICHSPLVKTALFASDPNWGRIVAAIGYAGIEELDCTKVQVWLDDVAIVADGGRAPSYREEVGQAVFDRAEFSIRVDLGRGDAKESLWTSDLSHDYVRINAEYRS